MPVISTRFRTRLFVQRIEYERWKEQSRRFRTHRSASRLGAVLDGHRRVHASTTRCATAKWSCWTAIRRDCRGASIAGWPPIPTRSARSGSRSRRDPPHVVAGDCAPLLVRQHRAHVAPGVCAGQHLEPDGHLLEAACTVGDSNLERIVPGHDMETFSRHSQLVRRSQSGCGGPSCRRRAFTARRRCTIRPRVNDYAVRCSGSTAIL